MRNKRDKDREKELFDVSFGEVQASTSICLATMKKCNNLGMHRYVPVPPLRQEGLQVRMASTALALNAVRKLCFERWQFKFKCKAC